MTDPAEKYRDKVSPEHAAAMQAIGLARVMLVQYEEYYGKFLASKDYMDSVGGMLDSTLYRDMIYSKSFALQLKLVKAALVFLKEVKEVEIA